MTDVEKKQRIVEFVCREYDTTIDEIKSKTKKQDIKRARHIAIFGMSIFTDYSNERIGRCFNRSRPTVSYVIGKMSGHMNGHFGYRNEVDRLVNYVTEQSSTKHEYV